METELESTWIVLSCVWVSHGIHVSEAQDLFVLTHHQISFRRADMSYEVIKSGS